MSNCRFCSKEFEKNKIAGHARWCDLNPKKEENLKKLEKARNSIPSENRNNGFSKAKKEGRKIDSPLKGKPNTAWIGKNHSEKTKNILREKALSSDHRRLKKNCIEYNGILLDSTWELELAKRLDFLGIKWIRPEPIKWKDVEGRSHNYFPDFYLIEYDVYLDPKNKHAINVQKSKLEILMKTYDNIVIIDSLEKCKNFII